MERRETKGYILIFAAGLLWGTIGIFLKEMSLCGTSALEISFLRMAFAFVCMMIISVACGKLPKFRITGKQLLICALLGVLCHGIHNILYCLAVAFSGVSVSAAVMNIAPAVTLITACILFSEGLSYWKISAILLNIFGCTLAVTGGDLSFENVSFIGVACAIGAGATYGLTPIVGRFVMKEVDVFVSSTYSYLFAALILVGPAQPWAMDLGGELPKVLILVTGLALIPTGIGYVIYYRGVAMIEETSKASVIASNQTVVACILGMIIFGEKMNLACWLGVTIILVSIALMNMKKVPSLNRKTVPEVQ